MKKQVAIFGDSWSYCSHKKMPGNKEGLTDLTFQSLFNTANITADNYSKQGGTNPNTINRIKGANSQNYDLLIVFQTDPIRQYIVEHSGLEIIVNEQLTLPAADNLVELCELTLGDFYTELAKFDHPILLIGGNSKLCFKYVPESITTLSKSWTELMVPDFVDNYFYWVEPTLGLYDYARRQLNWNTSLSDFFEFEKQIHQKNYIWQTSDDFSWTHSGDSAYYKMFNEIMEVINDLS